MAAIGGAAVAWPLSARTGLKGFGEKRQNQ